MKCAALCLAMLLLTVPTWAASPIAQDSSGCIKTSWLFNDKVQEVETVTYRFLLDVRNACGVAGQVNIKIVGTDTLEKEIDSFVMTSRLEPWQNITMTDKVPLPAEKDLYIKNWNIRDIDFYFDTLGQL